MNRPCLALPALLALAACTASLGSGGVGGGSGGGDGGGGGSPSCAGHADPGLAPDHLLVGLSVDLSTAGDDIAEGQGFDLRYQYISGGLSDGAAPCTSLCAACTSAGVSCSNASSPSCAWWGCWQWDQQAPGEFASGFVATAEGERLLPMLTYYQLLQSYRQGHPGFREGTPEVTEAARDAAFMSRYLSDLRFLLQRIGSHRALLHVEPDFWGYAQQAGADPHALPAAVASADPADCGGEEDSIAGLGRCVIAMARRYAPATLVGLHASPWASGFDLASNADASVDPAAQGAKVAAFLRACGAGEADLVVADLADRDADDPGPPPGHWLHADATLPSYTQILAFGKAVADGVGKPLLWWQVPVGNPSLADTPNHYRDGRLDRFLDHPGELAAQGAVGAAFGGGQASSTTPLTDGGHLAVRAAALAASGRQPLCK